MKVVEVRLELRAGEGKSVKERRDWVYFGGLVRSDGVRDRVGWGAGVGIWKGVRAVGERGAGLGRGCVERSASGVVVGIAAGNSRIS